MDEPVLKNIWTADVPVSDARFVLAVMARAEQRRFCRELATTIGLTAAAIGLLALVMPAVEFTWRQSFAPYTSNLVILGVLAAITAALPQLFPARD
jgi:hypothetical protein